MKRRSFVAGLGALSAGTAAAMGTGAFSSAEAQRSVSVNVAPDADAYLALESTSEYTTVENDGTLKLDFGQKVTGDGENVGEDSRYFFGSGDPDKNVFKVRNQGTNDVGLTPRFQILRFDKKGNPVDEDGQLIIVVQATNARLSQDPEDPIVRSPGNAEGYFVRVITGDSPPGSVNPAFEINASEV
jgi:hypothetical protein